MSSCVSERGSDYDDLPSCTLDETVRAITSSYELFVEMSLDKGLLKRPPAEGWPEFTPEYLCFLEKNFTVAQQLRYLP